MPTASFYTDDFLGPVSADQPVGTDLRWTADWDRIKEARRADDDLKPGKWAKKEQKTADWRLVEELASGMLRNRSKDWIRERNLRLSGFLSNSSKTVIPRASPRAAKPSAEAFTSPTSAFSTDWPTVSDKTTKARGSSLPTKPRRRSAAPLTAAGFPFAE